MGIGFLFPGQGSQSVGMMNALAAEPAIKETFTEAADVLGYDVATLVQEGPEEQLNQTEKTQAIMLTADVATWRHWLALGGPKPERMAGHSLGEYSALVCAEALSFPEALRLVAARGRFMQEAVPAGVGAMAAILMLDDEVVVRLCAEQARGEVVEAVNFNSPGQVVVAGHKTAVGRVLQAAQAAGAKRAVMLPLSVPSHCSLMKPAAARLHEMLQAAAIKSPVIPVIHNADVVSHSGADQIRDALTRQLYSPVRWVETVQRLKADGVDSVFECGPGKVLAGLNRRIDKGMGVHALVDSASIDGALAACRAVA